MAGHYYYISGQLMKCGEEMKSITEESKREFEGIRGEIMGNMKEMRRS